jgi:hypothetical protein
VAASAKASIPVEVKSIASSTLGQARTSSRKRAVELGHVHRRAEGLLPGRAGAGLQLASQVGDEIVHGHLEPRSRPAAPQGPDQVGVGQGAGVVQVERVAVLAAQVPPGPVGGGPQPARLPPVVQPPGGQRQLHGPELHVVLPGVLGIVGVRVGRHELADAGGPGHGEHRGRGPQQCPGPPAVARGLHLGAEGEGGGNAPGQVGADPRARRRGAKHRAVLDEVAGVEPAALDVHRSADRLERRRGHVPSVALEHRGGVHRRVTVGQVGRLAVEPPRDVRTVALDLEELDGVIGERSEQVVAGRDPERR